MLEKKVNSSRGTVYYWSNEMDSYNGIAIVFCHGLTADHKLFDKQVEHLSSYYKLITWDYPLHGKSRPYKEFSFKNVNQELLTILEQEKVSQIILVGQSGGGYIAQAFIKDYPDRVLGFVGIGTTPFGESYYKKSELFWIRHYTTIARMYPYSYYCKTGAKAVTATDEARESMYKTLVDLGKKGMLEAVSAVYGEFLKMKDEVKFMCPVLITYGEHENTGYVKKYNKNWAKKTGYTLRVIEDASHNANYDNYKQFNKLLVSFVDSIMK